MKHTHHDRKQKMKFALWPLASGIKMTDLLPAPPATKLKPVIPPESGHVGRTTFFACNHNGVGFGKSTGLLGETSTVQAYLVWGQIA